MALANCKKCSKIYEKRLSDLCPVCLEVDEENFRNLYRRLQKSASQGGIPITELANEVGVSVEEIEQIYLDGRFGTAGAMLKVPCINCSIMVGATQRKGRFCNACSEKTAAGKRKTGRTTTRAASRAPQKKPPGQLTGTSTQPFSP